ncbi:MAG: hypothetical protein JRJ59_11190 [Deltaproteobacteria bacterium]|nr:hypothetical protein [Deltaproteobacteria bacterium]
MALTADQRITDREGRLIGLKVREAQKIYGGSLVATDSTGYARPASDTAGLVFRGVARSQADNSAGLDGDKWVETYTRGDFQLAVASTLSQADLGRPVFVKDDGQVDLTSVYGVLVGRIVEIVSTSQALVRLSTTESEPDIIGLPVKAGEVISAEDFVAFDADGLAVAGADTAGLTLAGVAAASADNSGGSNGEIIVDCDQRRYVRTQIADVSQGNLGDSAYLLDATTLALVSAVSQAINAGKIVQVEESDDWAVVRLATF